MISVVRSKNQRIIKNFKHHDRSLFIQNFLQVSNSSQIYILQANQISKNAWEHVTLQTIANCFHKTSFLSENKETTIYKHIINWNDVSQGVNILFENYINTDKDLKRLTSTRLNKHRYNIMN